MAFKRTPDDLGTPATSFDLRWSGVCSAISLLQSSEAPAASSELLIEGGRGPKFDRRGSEGQADVGLRVILQNADRPVVFGTFG
ncbi:MAG: hypothetical protein VYB46_09850 [Pseudomonadota bacterium]|nr:hypothetical protein [Pseudomonadota bacterium]